MLTLAQELTASGRYVAVLVSAEVGAPFRHDIGQAERAILSAWRRAASVWLPPELQPPSWPEAEVGGQIGGITNVGADFSPAHNFDYR